MTYKSYKTYLTYFVVLCAALFFVSPVAHAAVLSKAPNNLGLVGYWPLNDSATNKAGDQSGQGNVGTLSNFALSGASSNWVSGKHGGALSFDGSDDYVSVANSSSIQPLSNSWTVAFWVNPITYGTGDYPQIIGSRPWTNGTDKGWAISLTNTGPQNVHKITAHFADGSTGWDVNSSTSSASLSDAPLNTWSHWVVVFDRANSKLNYYMNGVLDTQNSPSFPSGSINQSNLLYMGREIEGANGRKFNGKLDDVRIYNRALSASDVSALYRSGQATAKIVSARGLVGAWSFDEGRGGQVGDGSGQRNTGTLINTTWVDGKRGKALNFNGGSSYVRVTNNPSFNFPSSQSRTVSTWVYWNASTEAYNNILAQETASGGLGYTLLLKSNQKIAFYVQGTGLCNQDGLSGTVGFGGWHHIVATYDSSGPTITTYIDGALSYSGSVSGCSSAAASSDMFIGGNSIYGSNRWFNGKIDDVRIFNRALSASEAYALYKNGAVQAAVSQNSRLTNGLVGMWSFNGQDYNSASTTAEVLDRSGSNNSGDNIGATRAGGKVGQALQFNGSTNYVSVNRNISDDFTLSAWVNKNTSLTNNIACSSNLWYCGFGIIDAEVAGVLNDFGMGIKDNKLIFGTGNADVSILSTTTLSSNVWYHVVATRVKSTGALTIYINGVVENGGTGSTNSLTTPSKIYIGEDGDGNRGYFSGKIDEVRIYNRALSASEVYQLYNLGR